MCDRPVRVDELEWSWEGCVAVYTGDSCVKSHRPAFHAPNLLRFRSFLRRFENGRRVRQGGVAYHAGDSNREPFPSTFIAEHAVCDPQNATLGKGNNGGYPLRLAICGAPLVTISL
jgi:hypothetical protein